MFHLIFQSDLTSSAGGSASASGNISDSYRRKGECHSFTLTIHIFPGRLGILTGDLLGVDHTQLPLTVWRMSPRIDCPLVCACLCLCVCVCFCLECPTPYLWGTQRKEGSAFKQQSNGPKCLASVTKCQYRLPAASAEQEHRVLDWAISCMYMYACIRVCVCVCVILIVATGIPCMLQNVVRFWNQTPP